MEVASEDSELKEYNGDTPPLNFQILHIILNEDTDLRQKDRTFRFECRSSKSNKESLIEILSKRQMPVAYLTTQASHLTGAQNHWIESKVKEFIAWIDA